MRWRGKVAASVARRYFSFSEVGNELLEVEFAVELVYFWNFFLQLFLVSLRQTAHYVKLSELPILLSVHEFEYRIDALFLCRFNETAGIYNGDFAFWGFRIVHAVVAIGFKLFHQ